MNADDKISVERIEEGRFPALREKWNDLADRCQSRSLFLRHEWFEAAWEWRRTDSTMEILCVRRGAEVIGICPFMSRQKRHRGMTVKVIEFLNVPDTQLCDFIVSPSDSEQVVRAGIARVLSDCDMLVLGYIPDDSPTCRILDAHLTRHDVPGARTPEQTNPCIDLTVGWKNFYAGRSRRLKKANNWVANRLDRSGRKITLDWIRAGNRSPAEIDHALEETVRLSAQSWKQSTGLSLDRAGPNAFFHCLARHALSRDWLSLWILSLDGEAVAAELQMIFEGNVHALRSDFNVAYNELSVGSYLNWKQIEQLFSANLRSYWMGPGDNPYKAHWAEAGGLMRGYSFYGASWRARWLVLCDLWLVPLVKKFLGKNSRR